MRHARRGRPRANAREKRKTMLAAVPLLGDLAEAVLLKNYGSGVRPGRISHKVRWRPKRQGGWRPPKFWGQSAVWHGGSEVLRQRLFQFRKAKGAAHGRVRPGPLGAPRGANRSA